MTLLKAIHPFIFLIVLSCGGGGGGSSSSIPSGESSSSGSSSSGSSQSSTPASSSSSSSSSSSNSNATSSSDQNCPTFDELVPTSPINVDENSTTISGLSLPTGCNIEVLSIIQSDPVNSNGINPGWFGDLTQGEKTPFGNSDGSTLVITSDTTIGNANEITQLVSDIQIADGVTVTIGGNLHCDLKEIQTYNGILKAEKVKLRYCHIRAYGGDNNAPIGRIELKGVSMMRGTFAVPSGNAMYTQYVIEDSFLYDLIDGTGNIYSYVWYPREEGLVVKNSVFYMHGGFDIGFRSSSLTSPPIIDNNVFAFPSDTFITSDRNPRDLNTWNGMKNRPFIGLWAAYGDKKLSLFHNAYLGGRQAFQAYYDSTDQKIESQFDYFGITDLNDIESRYLSSADNLDNNDPVVKDPQSSYETITLLGNTLVKNDAVYDTSGTLPVLVSGTTYVDPPRELVPPIFAPPIYWSFGEFNFEMAPDYEAGMKELNYEIVVSEEGVEKSKTFKVIINDIAD